jgi:hypothetical protein
MNHIIMCSAHTSLLVLPVAKRHQSSYVIVRPCNDCRLLKRNNQTVLHSQERKLMRDLMKIYLSQSYKYCTFSVIVKGIVVNVFSFLLHLFLFMFLHFFRLKKCCQLLRAFVVNMCGEHMTYLFCHPLFHLEEWRILVLLLSLQLCW